MRYIIRVGERDFIHYSNKQNKHIMNNEMKIVNVSSEERKVILNSISKMAKYGGVNLLNHIDQVSNGLKNM